MPNLKTEVLNHTKYKITVKEGNAGIYSELQKLSPWDGAPTKSGSCTIEVDQNATFREYWMVLPPEHQNLPKIIVTSDDCVDSKQIKIRYDEKKKKFVTDKIPRANKHKEPANRNAAGNGTVVTGQANNNGAVAMVNSGDSTNPGNQPEIPPETLPVVQPEEGKPETKVKWFCMWKNCFTK